MKQADKHILVLFAHDKSMTSAMARKVENPEWTQIRDSIASALQHDGQVRLELVQPEGAYFREVCLYAEAQQWRLVVLTRDANPKLALLEWWEAGDAPFRGMVRVEEDAWDARTVSREGDVAEAVFRDFYVSGALGAATLAQFRSQWDPRP